MPCLPSLSRIPAIALIALAGVAGLATGSAPAAALEVVYLVRHAEKVAFWPPAYEDFRPLSAEGVARSEALARHLADREIAAIYASPTARALATGMPLAAAGVPIEADGATIDEDALPAFFDALRRRHRDDRAVLIVGHSNTVPMLLRALGATSECFARLGIDVATDLIEGYDGLWRIALETPGCTGMQRQSQRRQSTGSRATAPAETRPEPSEERGQQP